MEGSSTSKRSPSGAGVATATTTTEKNILLGKYELGKLLGRGTFAKVYFARTLTLAGAGAGDTSSSVAVAVKVLDKQGIAASGMPESRVLGEVSAMRRLSHPHIVRLHEVMATRSKIYLVMEYASGGSLYNRLSRRGRFSEPVVRRYFQQLVSALRFCHARGVSHRDVKPQNLLLDEDGNIKVSDFGLSALPEHLKEGLLHTSCGTPAYSAPEVLCRKGYDGAIADAWSCGVILFHLLAGYLPFDDSNIPLMYRKIHRRDYTFPPWFPVSAKRVVHRLLDPNPETRLTIEGIMDLGWFKRSFTAGAAELSSLVPENHAFRRAYSMNAFDIISLSKGLDLSGLFDLEGKKREQRFTSRAGEEEVIEKVREAGEKMGYQFESRKEGIVGVGRRGSLLTVAVSELAASLLLVELGLREEEGSATDEEELGWRELGSELESVVFSWHGDPPPLPPPVPELGTASC